MPATRAKQLYQIRNSSIHNRGLFAAADLKKGQRIVKYLGEKISKTESDRRGTELFEQNKASGDGTVYLFVLNSRWDIDGNVEWNDARLINHSCDPNCESQIINGNIWIMALRRIREGEELLFNYGFDLENVWDHPCRCGSPRCAGYIAGEEYWPKLRKMISERDQAISEADTDYAAAKKKAARKKKITAPEKSKTDTRTSENAKSAGAAAKKKTVKKAPAKKAAVKRRVNA